MRIDRGGILYGESVKDVGTAVASMKTNPPVEMSASSRSFEANTRPASHFVRFPNVSLGHAKRHRSSAFRSDSSPASRWGPTTSLSMPNTEANIARFTRQLAARGLTIRACAIVM